MLRGVTMSRKVLAIIATALVLAGCGTTSGGNSSTAYDPSMSVPDKGGAGGTGTDSGAVTPQVIRTGDMTLKTGDVAKLFEAVQKQVLASGGRVESSNLYNDSQNNGSQVIARVPESKLDATIAALSALATRTSLNISTSDVTLQTIDLQAKVKALTTSRDRLLALVEKAMSTSDLIAAEAALSQRQSELDSTQGQLDYLKTQVAESTLSISLVSDQSSVTSGLRGFGDTFRQAVRNFLQGFESVIIFVGSAIPWIILLSLLVAFGRWFNRRFSKLSWKRKS